MKSWLFATLVISLPLTAETLPPAQVKQVLDDMKNSNGAINKESSLVVQRCENQKKRKESIDTALGAFDTKVKELQDKIKAAEEVRKPFNTALEAAKEKLRLSLAEIESINRKLSLLGKPDQQMAALLKSKKDKNKALDQARQERSTRQAAFDKWEDAGDNARILDEALDLMAKGTEFEKLSPLQQEAVKIHKAFREKDESLFDLIEEIKAQLEKIEKDIKDLQDKKVQDRKTLEEQLKAEMKKRDDARKEIAKNGPEVKKYDQLIANYKGSINKLSGFRRVEVSEYCKKLGIQ